MALRFLSLFLLRSLAVRTKVQMLLFREFRRCYRNAKRTIFIAFGASFLWAANSTVAATAAKTIHTTTRKQKKPKTEYTRIVIVICVSFVRAKEKERVSKSEGRRRRRSEVTLSIVG